MFATLFANYQERISFHDATLQTSTSQPCGDETNYACAVHLVIPESAHVRTIGFAQFSNLRARHPSVRPNCAQVQVSLLASVIFAPHFLMKADILSAQNGLRHPGITSHEPKTCSTYCDSRIINIKTFTPLRLTQTSRLRPSKSLWIGPEAAAQAFLYVVF